MSINKFNMICLAGDGWGAVAAFDSLSKTYDSIQVVSNDPDLFNKLRFSDQLISSIADSDVDLVVCAGYKNIISKKSLQERVYINVHYSLLPKYRGMHSTVWAVINGEDFSGCTVHLMNEFIDDGPILAQFKTQAIGKTSTEIMLECNLWVRMNLGEVVSKFSMGKITPVEQDKSKATWVPKRNIEDCTLNFDSGSKEIGLMLLALVPPYPLPRFKYKGEVFEIVKARTILRPYKCTNGRVLNIDCEGVWVKIGDGFLVIQELINKDEIVPWGFFKIGARLGS